FRSSPESCTISHTQLPSAVISDVRWARRDERGESRLRAGELSDIFVCLQRCDLSVELRHLLFELSFHGNRTLGDLLPMAFDGFGGHAHFVEELDLLLDVAGRLLDRKEGLIGPLRLGALPDGERAGDAVRRLDVEIARRLVGVPHDDEIATVPL